MSRNIKYRKDFYSVQFIFFSNLFIGVMGQIVSSPKRYGEDLRM